MSDKVNFAKDCQQDSYNKRIFFEKNIDDKNILTTLRKTLILLKMWILKIQIMFQNYFRILELQKSFTTYKWVIMYMMNEKKL